MKKRTFAMLAAPAAIPPNPKIAAMIAITKKIAAHFNIALDFKNLFSQTVPCIATP